MKPTMRSPFQKMILQPMTSSKNNSTPHMRDLMRENDAVPLSKNKRVVKKRGVKNTPIRRRGGAHVKQRRGRRRQPQRRRRNTKKKIKQNWKRI
jgi:hypothetical protein